MTRQAVVIEYTFKGYTPPDDLEAMTVGCKVTHSDALQGLGGDLAQVRDALEVAGYERQPETAPIERYQADRYCPTWREVWVREIQASGGDYLSPRYAKAQREAAARARGYWPRLARTTDKAVILRPLDGGRRFQRQFAQGLANILPGYKFNSKRGWWEAPLEELATAREVLGCEVHLSDGVAAYLGEVQ